MSRRPKPVPPLTLAEIARFGTHLHRVGACLEWVGETNEKGYGVFRLYRNNRRFKLLAHRVAYRLATYEQPGELEVRHECDNPPCCDGLHLLRGTHTENMADMIARGRANFDGLAWGNGRGPKLLAPKASRLSPS